MGTWSAEKLQLADKAETSKRFFIRVSGASKDAFGDVQKIHLEGKDEFGFVTEKMTERELDNLRANHPEICQVIRIQD